MRLAWLGVAAACAARAPELPASAIEGVSAGHYRILGEDYDSELILSRADEPDQAALLRTLAYLPDPLGPVIGCGPGLLGRAPVTGLAEADGTYVVALWQGADAAQTLRIRVGPAGAISAVVRTKVANNGGFVDDTPVRLERTGDAPRCGEWVVEQTTGR